MSVYGYVKWKMIWYRNNDPNDAVDLTRHLKSISTTKTFKANNNSAKITLVDNDDIYMSGQFVPQENDKMYIWAKIVEKTNDRAFTISDIVWNGKFVDHSRSESADERNITFSVIDWGYDVYNRLHNESYINTGLKTDEIMTRVIKTLSENDDGTFKINTDNIATTRNDGSDFPVIRYGPQTTPAYEWFQDLSATQWTNSEAEQVSGLVIKYPMILDFRGNEAYWFEQPLSTVLTLDDSVDSQPIISYKNSTKNEETSNVLWIMCGEDLNGNPITRIIRDDSSSGTTQKESFKTVAKLAGVNSTYDNAYHNVREEAITAIPAWTNTEFRAKISELALSFSKIWFQSIGRKPDEFTVTLPKVDIELGEIIQNNKSKTMTGKYRVVSVSQSISSSEWNTTLRCEKLGSVN